MIALYKDKSGNSRLNPLHYRLIFLQDAFQKIVDGYFLYKVQEVLISNLSNSLHA